MDIQTAYIRVFGAAAVAVDKLSMNPPNVYSAKKVLEEAIAQTEEFVNLKETIALGKVLKWPKKTI